MNALITNTSIDALPIVTWIGAQPSDESLMLATGDWIEIGNDQIGRVDCGVVPATVTRLTNALATVDPALQGFIQAALAWFNQYNPTVADLSTTVTVTVLNEDNLYGIRALCGSNQDDVEIPAGKTRDLEAPGLSPGSLPFIELRQIGFDASQGSRGGISP